MKKYSNNNNFNLKKNIYEYWTKIDMQSCYQGD